MVLPPDIFDTLQGMLGEAIGVVEPAKAPECVPYPTLITYPDDPMVLPPDVFDTLQGMLSEAVGVIEPAEAPESM